MDIVTEETIPVIVITGPVGAGKSTVTRAVSDLLEARDIRHAGIDQDYLRWVHPAPDGDRFAARLGFRNLAAIWPNLRELGLRCVVVADVVEHPSQFAQYETAMPGTKAIVVRLDVDLALIGERLARRESGESLAWSLLRAPELHGIMERAGVGDLVIDVGQRTPDEIAEEIVARLGLT